MTRILIADDHDALRETLRSILTREGSWEVCGEARDGTEALEQVRRLSPDLVILDYLMPEMNGFEAARQIRLLSPSTKIVVWSVFDSPQMAAAAGLIGIDAYLAKGATPLDLIATLTNVLDQAGEPAGKGREEMPPDAN